MEFLSAVKSKTLIYIFLEQFNSRPSLNCMCFLKEEGEGVI